MTTDESAEKIEEVVEDNEEEVVEEEAVKTEVVVEEVEEEVEDEEDLEPLTSEEIRAATKETVSRVKDAGLHPLRKAITAYVNSTLDAIDGLLGSLEGNNRKKK